MVLSILPQAAQELTLLFASFDKLYQMLISLVLFFFCEFGIIDYVLNFSRLMNVLKSSRRKQLESYVHDTLLCFIEILH